MDIVEEFEVGALKVIIYPDGMECGEGPRSWDNLGTLVCWHPRYNLGDQNIRRDAAQGAFDAIPYRSVVLPVYLYDHSGLRVNTTGFSCPWDSGQVGFIYVSPLKAREEFGWKRLTDSRRRKIKEYLRGEIETLDQYLSGDVYGYAVVDPAENDEEITSCWGFYGIEECRAQARSAAEFELEERRRDPVQLDLPFN